MSDGFVPAPIRSVLRGVGQVFFQENALTGACFVVGIALSSPLMAGGRDRRRGDRHRNRLGAQVRQVRARRRDLRLQLGARWDCRSSSSFLRVR